MNIDEGQCQKYHTEIIMNKIISTIMNKFGPYTEEKIHQGFSVDCVVFSFYKGKLRVLLREFDLDDFWSLLGGFMYNDEDADHAAFRILEFYTGLKDIYLKQFHLFSDPNRTIMNQNLSFVKQNGTPDNQGRWLLRRFISMGYYTLVRYNDVRPNLLKGNPIKWFDIYDLPPLYSDHENIIKTAIETIRAMFPFIPIGYKLLPEKFTMTELRKVYEIFLNKKLDRRNFQRKILSEGHVVQLEEKKNNKEYNPPLLYSFKSPDEDVLVPF